MTRRIWMHAVGAACLTVTLLAGCAGTSGGAGLVGSWGSTASGKPNLTIESDGAFSGSDGCNRLSGKGEIDGAAITFGPIMSTLIGCPGIEVWLGRAATAKVSGDTLTVFDDSGSEIGSLTKSAAPSTP